MRKETLSITSEDGVDLTFPLAGLGARFFAGLLDTLFLILLCVALVFALPQTAFILVSYILSHGYHIFFDTLFQGRSPGKMIAKIQVVNHFGHHISFKESLIRNLLRDIDALFFLGAILISVDKKKQRLGDMAAGTIVIQEHPPLGETHFGASWVSRLERGEMPQALRLPKGSLNAKQLHLIVQFNQRKETITKEKREELALKIATPILPLTDHNTFNEISPEKLLENIYLSLLNQETADEKFKQWKAFETTAKKLLKQGLRGIKNLPSDKLSHLIQSYRGIVSDLARSRSKNTDSKTLADLNALAILGHQLLNRRTEVKKAPFLLLFPQLFRKYFSYMALSFCLFFSSAAIAYFAIQWSPELAFDLVSDGFLDFEPSEEHNMHNFPSISRPLVASQIITNNVQVTVIAFALGMTAGIGTALVLIRNGLHIGAVLSWLALQGHGKACLGWMLPHGATELLAIIIAGGAGFILADALLRPTQATRRASLKKVAKSACLIELGCMLMLLIAGTIEGFVSPSTIGFTTRLLWFIGSSLIWLAYFKLPEKKPQSVLGL